MCQCQGTSRTFAVCCTVEEPSGQGDPTYLGLLDELRDLHLLKSGGYGTGADPLANFTAVGALTGQARHVYPVHRSLEKIARCLSLIEQRRDDELGEEFLDVASLMLCAEAMRRAGS